MTIVVKKVPKCLRGIVKLLFGIKDQMNKNLKIAHTLYERRVLFFMEKNNKKIHPEVGEDTTKYGEFVSSYFAWIPLPKQKERAKELEQMTKNKEEKDDI